MRNAIFYNNNNLQAFQLIVLARYLLGVPNPSPAVLPVQSFMARPKSQ